MRLQFRSFSWTSDSDSGASLQIWSSWLTSQLMPDVTVPYDSVPADLVVLPADLGGYPGYKSKARI